MYYGYEGSLIVSDILSLMDWLDIALSDFLQWYLLQENAVVIHSIVGWKSLIGRWARVQGAGDYNTKLGITILGEDVAVEDEVVVVNCIVLPHKTITSRVQDEIIL
jgi:NDP-sugar pyrophosphorylase family protein